MQEKICLVIPCYNEAKRLDFKQFSFYCDENHYFLFVNDCSTDNTLYLLKKKLSKNMFLLNLDRNLGKGEAVRKGMLHIKTLPIFNYLDWVGYWDADLATPLYEVKNFLLYRNMFYPDSDAVFGSRIVRLGSHITRAYYRRVFSRLFATLIGFTLGITSYDSQCGAKLFKKQIVEELFYEPFISRWIFDLEILLRMKQKNIAEYPLNEWTEVGSGNLKVRTTFISVLIDIMRLRKKYVNSKKRQCVRKQI
ncbi:MAG: glycosyltransferase [Deltaproteobacteria bacterium]|nr:glycosyltransferase [Deltaproteobacteria bacterium]